LDLGQPGADNSSQKDARRWSGQRSDPASSSRIGIDVEVLFWAETTGSSQAGLFGKS
jgi:hypothetical protein